MTGTGRSKITRRVWQHIQTGCKIREEKFEVVDIDYSRRITVRKCPKCGMTFDYLYQYGDMVDLNTGGRDEQGLDYRSKGW